MLAIDDVKCKYVWSLTETDLQSRLEEDRCFSLKKMLFVDRNLSYVDCFCLNEYYLTDQNESD